MHYDASREVRAKGAGFYQFSGDEETRKAQMAELKASRDETTKMRQGLGAEDIMPRQEEWMTAGDGEEETRDRGPTTGGGGRNFDVKLVNPVDLHLQNQKHGSLFSPHKSI